MKTQHTHTSTTEPKRDLAREQGLRGPADGQPKAQAIDDAGLDDLGMSVEDGSRGYRGSGVVPADDVRSDNDADERHERR